ncbi:hypothetical protein FDP41_009719 [Naegleria fowleri]|uniref:Uncharacterized protein n=1 Tax=Naegleria fowleri TaxID=5763 RepID=A0A6A5AV95_NAEFO|nr:uncharacterized protein FDP41_009719 [Naegleria fowleri]KAF0972023.1 hypothetical protein FDP41_009719 [Naegleria fowleri]
MLNIFKRRCLLLSSTGNLLISSRSPPSIPLAVLNVGARGIGVASDSSCNFWGTESTKALFSSSCVAMKKTKSFKTNSERTSSAVNNHAANREEEHSSKGSKSFSNEGLFNKFYPAFRKHPKHTSYKDNQNHRTFEKRSSNTTHVNNTNGMVNPNNSSSNPEDTSTSTIAQPTNKIINIKISKHKKRSKFSHGTRMPSSSNNEIDESASLKINNNSDNQGSSAKSQAQFQKENYTIPQFKKELEYNVDKLLKQVLQKVKSQKPGEVEKNIDTDYDSFSVLKQDSDESEIFSRNELNVIDKLEEHDEEDIEKSSIKHEIDKRFLKPRSKPKKLKEEKDKMESIKLSAVELKNAVYHPSTGIDYRKSLLEEPIPPHQKFLVEFSDCEYVQLAETHPSEKDYIGNTDVSRIPKLANGLSRVLRSPGVHKLYDVKSNTFHFHPYLRNLHKQEEINIDNITPFIPPSKDESLHHLMNQYQCKYQSSTSAISPPLVSLYLLLSNFKPTKARNLENFKCLTNTFTPSVRKPSVFILRPKENIHGKTFYSIDSFKFLFEPRSNQILLDLGKVMEKLFVMEPEEFEKRYVKKYAQENISMDDADVYRYLRHGSFIIRSQLDCYDPQHGVFDIKTRAISRIRTNMENYERFVNSKIKHVKGILNSYEREFYDMVRSVFVKYSFQARIGDMDGMFVAYHNTSELFGFEYMKLAEIDKFVFGSTYMGERFFNLLLDVMRDVLDRITDRFPNIPLKITFRPLRVEPYFADIFVEPIHDDFGWTDRHPTPEERQSGS